MFCQLPAWLIASITSQCWFKLYLFTEYFWPLYREQLPTLGTLSYLTLLYSLKANIYTQIIYMRDIFYTNFLMNAFMIKNNSHKNLYQNLQNGLRVPHLNHRTVIFVWLRSHSPKNTTEENLSHTTDTLGCWFPKFSVSQDHVASLLVKTQMDGSYSPSF